MPKFGIEEAMKAEGFPLPDNVREARLILSPDSVMMMQYDVFLTAEDIDRLGKALQRMVAPETPHEELSPEVAARLRQQWRDKHLA